MPFSGKVYAASVFSITKSIGNVVAPKDVTNKLGADILRLWVASTDYTGEVAVSDEILKRSADAYRRIRNTARFFLANLNGFNPATDIVAADEMVSLDRWAVGRALAAQPCQPLPQHSTPFRHRCLSRSSSRSITSERFGPPIG